MKVYLDICCFNRPYDDQTQLSIHLETLAKLFIQSKIYSSNLELAWSYMLDYENSFNKNIQKRNAIQKWKQLSVSDISETKEILSITHEIQKTGIHLKDAIHIAAAIESQADYFITVDKRVLKYTDERIVICDPIEFVRKWEESK
jgi:predicted nucleic acid-binding protein